MHRSFDYYVKVFKFMMSSSGKVLVNIQSWFLLLLQLPDGSWRFSQNLAQALRAGDPLQPLELDLPVFNTKLLKDSIPPSLAAFATADACAGRMPSTEGVVVEQAKALGFNQDAVERIWATMLGVVLARRLPTNCFVNPEDPPEMQRTMLSSAEAFITTQRAKFQIVEAHYQELMSEAEQAVERYVTSHLFVG